MSILRKALKRIDVKSIHERAMETSSACVDCCHFTKFLPDEPGLGECNNLSSANDCLAVERVFDGAMDPEHLAKLLRTGMEHLV